MNQEKKKKTVACLHHFGGVLEGLGRVRGLEHLADLLLREAPLHPPVEVLPGGFPVDDVSHDALRLHPSRPVVEVGELVRHLRDKKNI